MLKEGDKAPAFSMPTDGNGTISDTDMAGKPYILYFYPKDDTSGCTAQACGFNDTLAQFNNLGLSIIGVSKDSVKKHDKFKEKYGLTFPLASDENTDICEQYGVWAEKSMYGKKYMGIERTTFLIDGKGIIRKIWHKVKVPGHIDEVLAAAQSLSA